MFKKILKNIYVFGIVFCCFMADKALSQTSASDCSNGRASFLVESDSMLPFAPKGSTLFLECFSHAVSNDQLERHVETLSEIRPRVSLGDVVAFKAKLFEGADGFKRVVGLPGNTIRFLQGRMIIDGKPVLLKDDGIYSWEHDNGTISNIGMFYETLPNGATYRIVQGSRSYPTQNTSSIDIPEGYVFVVGDHRDQSIDSRNLDILGLIPIYNLMAKVASVTLASVN